MLDARGSGLLAYFPRHPMGAELFKGMIDWQSLDVIANGSMIVHMDERLADILEATVHGFIRTSEPVSSRWLYDHYQFGIKPAMIRLELNNLASEGYLEQSHHSAGRVPTDKGYEFFVEQMLERGDRHQPVGRRERILHDCFAASEWDNFAELLSSAFGILGIVDDYESGQIYKNGLDDLVEHLGWDSPRDIREVIKDFEEIEDRLPAAREIFSEGRIRVFVGRKSPLTKSDCLSVVAGEYHDGEREVALFAIGPKRMDYEKVISAFKNF